MAPASRSSSEPRCDLGPGGRLIYALSQGTRVAWFFGQYRLAAHRAAPRTGANNLSGTPSTGAIFTRLVDLLRRDRGNIDAGLYRMPRDWLPRLSPALRMSRRFFEDLTVVNRRRERGIGDEVFRRCSRNAVHRYPRYYLQNFHYQTDGYLSDLSAELYDYQVEVLFYGTADAMRRQALVPLADVLRGRRIAEMRLLDVGAGTGRFLTFVKDNYPRLPVIALDLSPPYLRRARANLARRSWIEFVNANAEAMPLPDGSVDVVTCMYLFHELPRTARQAVAREIARVLRPGGRLIFIDSLQLGDDPGLDPLLEIFPELYYEPYYRDYIRSDLNRLFADAGLTTVSENIAFFSKVSVFAKVHRHAGR